jgi:ABC-type phosphate/phosphonate transport system substrate-binding protein
VQKRQWLDSGFIKVIAQEGMKSDPELNKAHVPMALSFATTAQQRKLMELFYAPLTFGRPFIVAPDVPAERLAALRKAFMQTMADPELKAEAEKVHLDVDAISGEEVRKTIVSIYQTKADIVAQAKAAIGSH